MSRAVGTLQCPAEINAAGVFRFDPCSKSFTLVAAIHDMANRDGILNASPSAIGSYGGRVISVAPQTPDK
jgi:hypothetical protein